PSKEEAQGLLPLIEEIAAPGPVGIVVGALGEPGEVLEDPESLVEERGRDAGVRAVVQADVVKERELRAERLRALRSGGGEGIDVVEVDEAVVHVVPAQDAREARAAGVEGAEDPARPS